MLGSQLGLVAFQCSAVETWSGVNEGHNSWTSGMKMLFQALVKHSLNSERGATKNYDTYLHLR